MEPFLDLSCRVWRWSLPVAALAILWAWLAGATVALLAVWQGIVA